MKLIPLDAVLAEIKRRKQVAFGWLETAPNDAIEAQFELCDDILSFLDTLEVKEMDLEKEWKEFLKDGDVGFKEIANHFFKLGLNASNPLTWEDMKLIWTIGDDIPPMAEEDFFKELLKRFNLKSRFNKV